MRRRGFKFRIFIFIAVVAFAYLRKCSQEEVNPYTGKTQAISLSPEQEIAIGLQSAPEMAQQHGGLHPDNRYQALVDNVGQKLVNNSVAKETPYQYEFHLLADERTINAFALPGGQIFITYALFSKLENEDQLAGVLGHEIGHVLGKHSNERITDANFGKLLLWEALPLIWGM
jgi:predicted Zn-dependent protease